MVDSSNRGLREVHEMSQRGSSVASPSVDKFHYKAFPPLRDTNSLPSSCCCIVSLYINTMKGDYRTIQLYPFMVYLFIASSGYALYYLPEYQAERYISISALASSRSAFSKCVPSIFFCIMKGKGEFYARKTHHRTTTRNRTNLRPTSQRRRPRVIHRFNECRS